MLGSSWALRNDVSLADTLDHAIRTGQTGSILVIEDDAALAELLEMVLREEGHFPISAPDGAAALDLILADYNLPNGMDGLTVAAKVRERLRRRIPVIVLTEDISTEAHRQPGLRTAQRAGQGRRRDAGDPAPAADLAIRVTLAGGETGTNHP